MSLFPKARQALASIPKSRLVERASQADYTRFSIGGPAALFFDTADESAFVAALRVTSEEKLPRIIIGGGTNLIVSDTGFAGVVLRYTGSTVIRDHLLLTVGAGAVLQE